MKHELKKTEITKQKADLDRNSSGLDDVIKKHMERERPKFPLRINRQTVILVVKEKCNEEYAKWYRENRMNVRKDDRGCL